MDGFDVFKGFIDTSDDLELLDVSFGEGNEQPNEVNVKFKKNDSIQYFSDKITGVSFGSLLEDGTITKNDFTNVTTVVQKRFDFVEFSVMILSIYLLQKQLSDTVKEVKTTISQVLAFFTAGSPFPVASAVYKVAVAIIQIAYAVALLGLISSLVIQLIQLLLPPRVENKGMTLKTLLNKACEKFGYTLETDIEELDQYVFLPSKPFDNEKGIFEEIGDFFFPFVKPNTQGIPSTSDFGYLINEMFDLCSNLFRARTNVVNNRVLFYNEFNPIWYKFDGYTPRTNIKLGNKKFNTSELPQTRLLSFITDPVDLWTVENYTGTAYEIKTETKKGTVGTIKGLDRIDFPICLPVAKTSFTPLEKIVYECAKIADSLTALLGQKTNLASNFDLSVNNVLKVSTNQFTVPKLVPLNGRRLPSNLRQVLSAKTLYEKFHAGTSFVTGDRTGQKVIYTDVEIPFNIDDLQKTINSASFTLTDGRRARFREISYLLGRDVATATIEVQEVYTTNLKEVYYEP